MQRVTRLRGNPWAVLLVLCAGFFMILLDITIVNIAIPAIIDGLQASLDQILWVLNGYVLVYAVLLITAGRLGDLFGQRNMFALGLFVFVVASVMCGLAQDTNQLIGARVLQGLGGAMLTPQTLAILTTIFPPERRGAAFGIWGAVAGIAGIAGPSLGGVIVAHLSWRWIFFVNVPVGVLALLATFAFLPNVRSGRRHRLDLVGVALASIGLFGIVFGLVEGERFDWGALWGWLTVPQVIGAGVLILALFVAWERRQEEPLIPLSLFGDRNYSVMNAIGAAMSFGMIGLFLPMTLYLQSVLGMTALVAGLTMLPMPLVSVLVAPMSGRLADRTGGRYLLMAGLLLFAAAMGLIVWLASATSSAATFVVPFIVGGLGQGLIFAPMTTIAMRHVDPRVAGVAAGVLNTTRQVGLVLGSAVVGAMLQNQLVAALYARAVTYSAELPSSLRQPFVDGLSAAAKNGLEFGRVRGGGFSLPPDLPQPLADLVVRLAHAAFVDGFVDAMRPTIIMPLAAMVLAVFACLVVEGRSKAAARARSGKA